MAKAITAAERRYQDHLRQVGVRTAENYARMLAKLRNDEVARVVSILKAKYPTTQWPLVAPVLVNETYLANWYRAVIVASGMPQVGPTARALAGSADAVSEYAGFFEQQLANYAKNRAGAEIVSVTGTMKEAVQRVLNTAISQDVNISVEKLARAVSREMADKNFWMARRIAQTEMMNALAEAGQETADVLQVPYTKTWCISGVGNTRETHEVMDGQEVGQDDFFELVDCVMRYPHDTGSNPPAGEIINCACSCIRRPQSASDRRTVTVDKRPQISEEEQRIRDFASNLPADIPVEARRAFAENFVALEDKLGIKKGDPMSVEAADMQSANPNYSPGSAYSVNCATCAPAYELRRRGFDVTAKGNVKGSGSLNERVAHDPWQVWQNADGTAARPVTFLDYMTEKGIDKMTEEHYVSFLDRYCAEPGTYEIAVTWGKTENGHATILERLADGSIKQVEPQLYLDIYGKGPYRDIKWLLMGAAESPTAISGVMRLGDKIFNPEWSGLFGVK